MPLYEKQRSLLNSCSEIFFPEENYQEISNREHLKDQLFIGLEQSVFGLISGTFSFMNSTKEQREYKAQIDNIKKIKNRSERIKQVYELVVNTMGYYDQKMVGIPMGTSPGFGPFHQELNPANIVQRARTTGSGGVCRNNAALLAWSLRQVAEDSFSVDTKMGCTKQQGCHMWVRLNFPSQTKNGINFESLDLDSSLYDELTFLHPRLNGISPSEKLRLSKLCNEMNSCMRRTMLEKIQSQTRPPNKFKGTK